MSAHPFGVEVSAGGLSVSGEVDMAVASTLLDAIVTAGQTGPAADLVVDLSQVTFLDSSGISALIEAQRRLAASDVELRVSNASPFVTKVFAVSGVDRVLGGSPAVSA